MPSKIGTNSTDRKNIQDFMNAGERDASWIAGQLMLPIKCVQAYMQNPGGAPSESTPEPPKPVTAQERADQAAEALKAAKAAAAEASRIAKEAQADLRAENEAEQQAQNSDGSVEQNAA